MAIREGREDDVFKYAFKNCFDNDDDHRYENVDVDDKQEDEGDDALTSAVHSCRLCAGGAVS